MNFNDVLFIFIALGFLIAGIITGIYIALYLLKDKYDRSTAAIHYDEAVILFTTPFPIDPFHTKFRDEMSKYIITPLSRQRKYPRAFRYNCNDCGGSFVAEWLMMECPKCDSKEAGMTNE